MRKVSFVLACIVAVSSAGCGGGGGDSASAVGGSTPPPSTPTPPAPPPPATTLGSATISWVAPMQNTDGSALTPAEIAGFEIRYGQNANALDSTQAVNGVGTTTYVIPNLTAGTWYFTVAARSTNGVMSAPSAPASKVIS